MNTMRKVMDCILLNVKLDLFDGNTNITTDG